MSPSMTGLAIGPDDPTAADVRALLARHLAFTSAASPPEDCHALDVDALAAADALFFSARCDGRLLGVAALQQIDDRHVELKSMHTAGAARGRGVGRAMLEHLVAEAGDRGCTRVSLETGSMAEFAPARSLYESAGFEPCGPCGHYVASSNSAWMTLDLTNQ